jgi:hypothetical protein
MLPIATVIDALPAADTHANLVGKFVVMKRIGCILCLIFVLGISGTYGKEFEVSVSVRVRQGNSFWAAADQVQAPRVSEPVQVRARDAADAQFPWQAAGTALAGCLAFIGVLIGLWINTKRQNQEFEWGQLAAEFRDILDRLADTDSPPMRANAANRLAEMGTRRPRELGPNLTRRIIHSIRVLLPS